MADISLKGMNNAAITALPEDLLQIGYNAPRAPGLHIYQTTDLGHHRTLVHVEDTDVTADITVKNYKVAQHQFADEGHAHKTIVGGTIQSIHYINATQELGITHFALDAATLLAAVDAVHAGGNEEPLLTLMWGTSYNITGRNRPDHLQWDLGSTLIPYLFSGNDTFRGRGGDDILYLYGGNDRGFGGAGNDGISGGKGRDLLSGGGGNDEILGGAGNDDLRGGDGADQLAGARGDDTITGGRGADTFDFDATSGDDTITDYQSGRDTIQLMGSHGVSLEKVHGGVLLTHTGGTVLLEGIHLSDISTSDILGW